MPAFSPLQPRCANPSPSKRNPFARVTESTSFTRKGLLPAHSPTKSTSLATPVSKKTPSRSQWRMLWRGGFEIGPDGWRLDGVTFFALLTFPGGTPTATPNPFAPPTPGPSDPALPSDADLCLSLESMRGRKWLAVRSVIVLADEDALDGEEAGIQMSTSSPLLEAYFTGILCRDPLLAPSGRTKSAVMVGLGDEGVDGASFLIYGQRVAETSTFKLCVGRKKPPALPETKVRPGEPLPRAATLFPDVSRRSQVPKRGLSRASSMHAVYQAPSGLGRAPSLPPGAGRVGEKRVRGYDDERKRRSGLIVPERGEEEDIFGPRSRASSVRPSREGGGMRAPSVARSIAASTTADDERPSKKPKPDSKQAVDNKGAIRKAAMYMLEERGYARDHAVHKEVWPVAYKGAYFALRHRLDAGPIEKAEVRDCVGRHLEMYLPPLAAEEPPIATPLGRHDSAATHVSDDDSLPPPHMRTPERQMR